jgi:hypothetical protein
VVAGFLGESGDCVTAWGGCGYPEEGWRWVMGWIGPGRGGGVRARGRSHRVGVAGEFLGWDLYGYRDGVGGWGGWGPENKDEITGAGSKHSFDDLLPLRNQGCRGEVLVSSSSDPWLTALQALEWRSWEEAKKRNLV